MMQSIQQVSYIPCVEFVYVSVNMLRAGNMLITAQLNQAFKLSFKHKTNLPLPPSTLSLCKRHLQVFFLPTLWWELVSGAEWVLIVSADETQADVNDDKHTSFVLIAVFEARAEMDAMATRYKT